MYLPAYVAAYTYGQVFNSHGEREGVRSQALISALDPTSIAAERHYSPQKVQLAAGSAMAGLGLVGLAVGVSGLRSWSDLLNAHSAFWVFMVCSAAGNGRSVTPTYPSTVCRNHALFRLGGQITSHTSPKG